MGDSMLAKCANPVCASAFRYLSKGKLFLTDPLHLNVVRSRERANNLAAGKREWFWLCERCCTTMAIAIDGYGNARTISLCAGNGLAAKPSVSTSSGSPSAETFIAA